MKRTFIVFLLMLAVPLGAAEPAEIAPGVYLLRGEFVPGRQPDGNSVVFEGTDGLILVDSGRHSAHTRALLAFAATKGLPVRAVVNTHWHLDHTGGNVLIRKEVPAVKFFGTAAIDEALKGFLATYAGQLKEVIAKSEGEERSRYTAELALIESGQLAPDERLTSSGTRTLAGRPFDIRIEDHAVTAGDLWLIDVRSSTAVAGDLITLPIPFFDTACPSRWRSALDALAKEKFERLVPGHGPVMSRADVARYAGAFGNLIACGASERNNDACITAWIADAGALIRDEEHDLVRQGLNYYLDAFLRPGGKTAHLCQ